MKENINKGRRECIKNAGLFVAAVFGTALANKLSAITPAAENFLDAEQQQRNRIARKAVYVAKNCKIHKQVAAKTKNPEQCSLCIEACPKECITLVDVKNAKGVKAPVLTDEALCIGCGRCYRVCPEEPKGWEIWDRTNNKKLM